jgi:hypothetical protein
MKSRGFPHPGEALDMAPGHGLLEIYEEVERGLPVYLHALGDADSGVRASAAHVLAFLPRKSAESVPVLMNALNNDADTGVRASCALALSLAASFESNEKERAIAALTAAWPAARTDLERRALALALVRCEREATTALALPALVEHLAAGVPSVALSWPFPWTRIDSALFVYLSAFYGVPEAQRPDVAMAAGRGLSKVVGEDDASDLAFRLAYVCLGPPQPGVVPKAAELDRDAREVLLAIAGAPLAWTYSDLPRRLEGHGLPRTRAEFRAWLSA